MLFLVRTDFDGSAGSLPPRSVSSFFHILEISLRPSYAASYMSITEEFEGHLSTPWCIKEKQNPLSILLLSSSQF